MLRIGLDIGSTTIKCAVLDERDLLVFLKYERHLSKICDKINELLTEIKHKLNPLGNEKFSLAISGSAAMGLANELKIDFISEVFACKTAVEKSYPNTDVVIELGGEDAKILYLSGAKEVRMNGSCAGGTGAFIDQMATLLGVSVADLDELSKNHQKIYTIASRCGVFAKTDIQPLMNQGACKEDIAASIFAAVANQTVAGLAQGRKIEGNIMYLGGPLTFLSGLRDAFDDLLKVEGICPENSLYYVSIGTALLAKNEVDLDKVISGALEYASKARFSSVPKLFETDDEYQEFIERHKKAVVKETSIETFAGDCFLGIDAGSTTVKIALVSLNGELICSMYKNNSANPVPIVREFLTVLYERFPKINIIGSATTGYGEELIKNAFKLNLGIVETIAHYKAASYFMKDVDFIIDIGGQDMKCFKIRNGAIDNIFLNEACSSGCGSFLESFAATLGYDIKDFAALALESNSPVDLGSRCTVFMNSSVKEAQKEGASVADISAGLAISVVKNAIYKVIRAGSADELGKHIVVQGGTFLNDAVLRVFEKELNVNVVRPNISGLMGAFGAALYARDLHEKYKANGDEKRLKSVFHPIISLDELKNFKHDVKTSTCRLCQNYCNLTINTFADGSRFIGGNRCDKPIKNKTEKPNHIENMYDFKRKLIDKYRNAKAKDMRRGEIAMPLALNTYELLPFWKAFFAALSINLVTSNFSNRALYVKGQHTIPSDTVCFPAKLINGHIDELIKQGYKRIFYPCMTYNFDEKKSDNHYNCPVVAYYPEVIDANVPEIKAEKVTFIKDYIGIHRKKDFPKKMFSILKKYIPTLTLKEVEIASNLAYREYDNFERKIKEKGLEVIKYARENDKQIIILAGRPYHIDPEICHGIDNLIASMGAVVVTEDVISHLVPRVQTKVLNQWTYHARLYQAAKYVSNQKDMNLVQLVSFGCGIDAITTDEVRSILERKGKIYTQIKIDEITNLGAVKIRLRSLFAALQ